MKAILKFIVKFAVALTLVSAICFVVGVATYRAGL